MSEQDALNVVLQCLGHLTSAVNEERMQAEKQLEYLGTQAGFGVLLVRVTLDDSIHKPLRQLAAIALKKYVKEHWSKDEEIFVPPKVNEQDRNSIKQMLPRGLSDADSKIRTAVAMAIASVAHWDWPDSWPGLIEELIKCLWTTDENLVKGSIRCLDIFADGDNLSDNNLPVLFNLLLPELLKVFGDNRFSDRIKTRAISIVYSLLRWLAITKDQHKAGTDHFFKNLFPPWLQAFISSLTLPANPQDCGLSIAIMKVLIVLIADFPKEMKVHISSLIAPVWNLLLQGISIYERVAIIDDMLSSTAQDSDGESLGFESLVQHLLEFIHCIVERRSSRNLVKGHLSQLFFVCLKYMQMTQDQEDIWQSDPNEYVAGEDEEYQYTVRLSANGIIGQTLEIGSEAVQALSSAVSKSLEESSASRESGAAHWWKLREAAITAVGNVVHDITDDQNQGAFDVQGFLQNVLAQDLNTEGVAFLRGRALWCASKLTSEAKVEPRVALPFLTAAVTSLQSPNESIPVKIGACQAIYSFCPTLSQNILTPYLPSIIEGVLRLVPSASEGTLLLLLDSLLVAVKVRPEISVRFADSLTAQVLNVWSKNVQNSFITDAAQSILAEYLRIPECYPSLVGRMLTPVMTVLKSPKEIPAITEAALGLLLVVVKSSPSPIPESVLHPLPLVGSLVIQTDDAQVLHLGILCLTAYVRAGVAQLANWPLEKGSALNLVVQVIAHALSPSLGDPAASCIGPLIQAVVTKGGEHLGNVMGEILGAVVTRLQHAKLPSFIQSLLMVFVRLFQSHPQDVLSFLGNMPLGNSNALVYVLSTWTRVHEDFHGAYAIKQSTAALAKIFQLNDPQLDALTVQGELLPNQQGEIFTRSKTKANQTADQWTTVPLRTKILHIILNEYLIAIDEGKPFEEEGDEEDEDGEYLDELLGTNSPFVDASEFFGDDGDEIDDDEDPDARQDPIYNLNLKQYCEDFLRSFGQANPTGLTALAQHLNIADKEALQELLNS